MKFAALGTLETFGQACNLPRWGKLDMNDVNDQVVNLGDQVKLPDDSNWIVVAIIDSGENSAELREAYWNYLKTVILVKFPKFGLIHYAVPEGDLELILREGG